MLFAVSLKSMWTTPTYLKHLIISTIPYELENLNWNRIQYIECNGHYCSTFQTGTPKIFQVVIGKFILNRVWQMPKNGTYELVYLEIPLLVILYFLVIWQVTCISFCWIISLIRIQWRRTDIPTGGSTSTLVTKYTWIFEWNVSKTWKILQCSEETQGADVESHNQMDRGGWTSPPKSTIVPFCKTTNLEGLGPLKLREE